MRLEGKVALITGAAAGVDGDLMGFVACLFYVSLTPDKRIS